LPVLLQLDFEIEYRTIIDVDTPVISDKQLPDCRSSVIPWRARPSAGVSRKRLCRAFGGDWALAEQDPVAEEREAGSAVLLGLGVTPSVPLLL
jgi:hypothetical protein